MQALRYSSDIVESGVTINGVGRNSDGVDLVGVKNVILSDLDISDSDDNIAIKSGLPISTKDYYYAKEIGSMQLPTSHVLIKNITARLGQGLSIGSEAANGINDVTIENVNFTNILYGFHIKSGRDRGAEIYDIQVNHFVMSGAGWPIAIDSYYSTVGPNPQGPAQPIDSNHPARSRHYHSRSRLNRHDPAELYPWPAGILRPQCHAGRRDDSGRLGHRPPSYDRHLYRRHKHAGPAHSAVRCRGECRRHCDRHHALYPIDSTAGGAAGVQLTGRACCDVPSDRGHVYCSGLLAACGGGALDLSAAARGALPKVDKLPAYKVIGSGPLVVVLAMDMQETLYESATTDTIVPRLLSAGYSVMSLDLPCHGADAEPGMQPLVCWAQRIAAGDRDIFLNFCAGLIGVLNELGSPANCDRGYFPRSICRDHLRGVQRKLP